MNQASKNEKDYQNMSCISHTDHPKDHGLQPCYRSTVSTIFIFEHWKKKKTKDLKKQKWNIWKKINMHSG